ncbi:MAG: glutaredoxin family protein [Firmicutes bacterium]|nr:glutaredoxin family protein [Bacillota bacterium]
MSDVTIYTTPQCPWCHKAKEFLESKGVNFEEKNVAADSEAAEKMIELTGQRSVPVISKGGLYVVGYSPEQIEKLLV